MSSPNVDRLILGRGFSHATAAASFTTSSVAYALSAAALYDATSRAANRIGVARFVEVSNDDTTNFITVTVGNSLTAAAAATAGDTRVYPRTSKVFQLEQEGIATINVKADTATCAGSVNWYR